MRCICLPNFCFENREFDIRLDWNPRRSVRKHAGSTKWPPRSSVVLSSIGGFTHAYLRPLWQTHVHKVHLPLFVHRPFIFCAWVIAKERRRGGYGLAVLHALGNVYNVWQLGHGVRGYVKKKSREH